jgi:hypothetical protein
MPIIQPKCSRFSRTERITDKYVKVVNERVYTKVVALANLLYVQASPKVASSER